MLVYIVCLAQPSRAAVFSKTEALRWGYGGRNGKSQEL